MFTRFPDNKLFLLCFALLSWFACSEPIYSPKPRMYPYVAYPDYQMQTIPERTCPYRFKYPSYAIIEEDSTYFEKKLEHSCWLNAQFPMFHGTLHCSYYLINAENNLEKCIKDSYKLAREHQKKANYIDEHVIRKPNNVYGMLFNIEGPVASPFQFYLTDSSQYFFRGALYFNSTPKPDSLQPVVEFIKKDVLELINSFEWKTSTAK